MSISCDSAWEVLTLAEAGVSLIDCVHKTPPAQETGLPYIAIPQMKEGHLDFEGARRISETDFIEWTKKALPEAHDVVLSRRCNPGTTAAVTNGDKFALGQNLVLLRANGTRVFPPFLRWLVRGQDWWNEIGRFLNVGAVFDSLRCADVPKFELPIPPLNEQRAIASVLGSLDDKIELNRRMNRTLEQMAAAIFKAWFVDFEPVRAKASGAASFPGMPQPVFDALPATFADSELGPIPEGWEAGCIGDIGKNRRDGIQPSEIDAETPYIGLEHMPKRCIALDAWDGAGKVTSGKSEFSRGEILFGKLRPYFHKVGVAPIDGVCSTDVLVVKPKARHWSALLLGHLSSLDFVNYTDACSTGTKMPRTNWKDMARYPIAIPSEPLAAEATRIIEPMIETILSNIHESRTLAETRDALLPKLLSGEVRAVASMEEEALA